jgi:hypothetical protein
MNFIRYLLICTSCLTLSYIIYRFIFRSELRFGQQRVFIIASLLLSIFLPLIDFSFYIPGSFQNSLVLINSVKPLSEENYAQVSYEHSGFNYRAYVNILLYLYISMSVLFIMSAIFQIIKISWLARICRKESHNNLIILRSEKIKNPFSFLKWIFIPESITDLEERQSIIIHESVHSSQYHSLDNLIIELATGILWFNPVIWMMKRSLHLVHEYLADAGTLEAGIEKLRYQTLLLNQVAEDRLIYIHSGFNNNLLKKRMIMMTKSKNTEDNKFRLLNLVSLSTTMFLTVTLLNGFFSEDVKASARMTESTIGPQQEVKKEDVKGDKKKTTVTGNAKPSGGEQNARKKTKTEIKKADSREVIVVGYGNQKSQKSKDTLNYIVDGVSVKSMDDINPDSIESVNVMKTDRLIIVRTKAFARRHPAIEAGSISMPENKINLRTKSLSENITYIVDEKKTSKNEIENIPADQIESIEVIRDKEKIMKYGSKNNDGVIIITTKVKK